MSAIITSFILLGVFAFVDAQSNATAGEFLDPIMEDLKSKKKKGTQYKKS